MHQDSLEGGRSSRSVLNKALKDENPSQNKTKKNNKKQNCREIVVGFVWYDFQSLVLFQMFKLFLPFWPLGPQQKAPLFDSVAILAQDLSSSRS